MLSTGLLPRSGAERERLQDHGFSAGAPVQLTTIIQPIAWIRNQLEKPSCVGQTFAAGVDASLLRAGKSAPPWCSAVDLWKDARRRQGRLDHVLDGTRAEFAIEALIRRGWSAYQLGEDAGSASKDDDKPDLDRELFADDRRMPTVTHYDIGPGSDRVERVVAALQRGYVVGLGTGVRHRFFNPPRDTVLDDEYLGGNVNGHEMRVVGYVADMDGFLLQNSWGEAWAGFELDRPYRGCCLVSLDVVEQAWDIDALEVRV
jgi:hypothetical protein